MLAAYTAKELDAAILAWRAMCCAHEVRNDQSDFRAISVGPASELSADHENAKLLSMPAAASCTANHWSRSMRALHLAV